MNTLEAIAKRVSVRSYQPEQIPEDALHAIIKAGMAAPVSSGAYDSLHLTVIQDSAFLKEIGDAVNELIFQMLGRRMNKKFGAPTMNVVSSKPSHVPGMEMANAANVAENMVLAATDLGIGNIMWAAAPGAIARNPGLLAKLKLPEGFRPVLAVSLGYAAEEEAPKQHTIPVNRV